MASAQHEMYPGWKREEAAVEAEEGAEGVVAAVEAVAEEATEGENHTME
jgi:hypothetical protein